MTRSRLGIRRPAVCLLPILRLPRWETSLCFLCDRRRGHRFEVKTGNGPRVYRRIGHRSAGICGSGLTMCGSVPRHRAFIRENRCQSVAKKRSVAPQLHSRLRVRQTVCRVRRLHSRSRTELGLESPSYKNARRRTRAGKPELRKTPAGDLGLESPSYGKRPFVRGSARRGWPRVTITRSSAFFG